MTHQKIEDTHLRTDSRNLELKYVGIKKLLYPIRFDDMGYVQYTNGIFDLSVSLDAQQKGAHLSRFVGLLQEYHSKQSLTLSLENLSLWHLRMLNSLEASYGSFSCSFSFFLEKKAPVSKQAALLKYDLTLTIEGSKQEPEISFILKVPVTSLCPCSKEISNYGAHNQRSFVTVSATALMPFKIKDLILLIEKNSSCDIYSLLKRTDEKAVTEKAFEHPKFSEDIVRDIYQEIKTLPPILKKIKIESEHEESIHHHNAYSIIVED